MKGYYKAPELSSEAFEHGWFKTGDYGKLTKDNKLIITGRKKNLIVLNNGENIYPEEIENYIMSLPYVSEVVVKSTRNRHGDETGLIAEIYGEEPITKDIAEIEKDISDVLAELPAYKHITEVVIRKKPFRKTTSRKIVRQS